MHLHNNKFKLWRNLQAQFLADHTLCDWEYVVVANNCNPDFDATVIRTVETFRHLDCINIIIDHFRCGDYTHLLLLDSDAWPVRNWVEIALTLLGDKYYLAPMRVENYDDFPHPSAFFMKREFLEHVDFGYDYRTNLLGDTVTDVGSAMPQSVNGEMAWVPLIKTNGWAPHPVFCAVYGDLFYHHGAGTRAFTKPGFPGVRVLTSGIHSHLFNEDEHGKIYNRMTELLEEDPAEFIDRLRYGFKHS